MCSGVNCLFRLRAYSSKHLALRNMFRQSVREHECRAFCCMGSAEGCGSSAEVAVNSAMCGQLQGHLMVSAGSHDLPCEAAYMRGVASKAHCSAESQFMRSWPHASCLRKRHQFARSSSPFMSHTNCDISTFKGIMVVPMCTQWPPADRKRWQQVKVRKTLCNSNWEMAATRLTKKCQLGRHDSQHTCRYNGRFFLACITYPVLTGMSA